MAEFEFHLEDHLFLLHEELINKTYKPDPYQAFFVCDPKIRHIHKATVRDRILHQAIFRILYPIFDKHFIYDSYSSRLGKGTHRGSERLFKALRKVSRNWRWPVFALKCDVRKFFDSIDHEILFALIEKRISDPETLWLIDKVLRSFEKSSNIGLPLGNVTSQLFANIYLNELDQFVKHRLKTRYYFRYADDFIILFNDKPELVYLLRQIGVFLKEQLKLNFHPDKIQIRKLRQGIDFVGYVILPDAVILRTKTKKRIFKKLKKAKSEMLAGKISEEKFSKIKASYLGVLKHCKDKEIKRKIKKVLSWRK